MSLLQHIQTIIYIIIQYLLIFEHDRDQNIKGRYFINSYRFMEEKIFRKCNKTFEIEMRLNPNGKQGLLLIDIRNYCSLQGYHLLVDLRYIQERPELASCTQSVQKLYELIDQQFEDLTVTDEGAIILEFTVNFKNKQLQKKVLILQASGQQIDDKTQTRLQNDLFKRQMLEKIQKTQQDMMKMKIEYDQEIKGLNSWRNQFKNQRKTTLSTIILWSVLISLISIVIGYAFLIAPLQAEIVGLKSLHQTEIQAISQRLAKVQKTIQTYFDQLFIIKDIFNTYQREEKRKINLQNLQINRLNSHFAHFQIKENKKAISIYRKSEITGSFSMFSEKKPAWKIYTSTNPLSKDELSQFKIKLVVSKNQNIMVGIGSENAFGNDLPHKHYETVLYYLKEGTVWENGVEKQGGPPVLQGQTITIKINLSQNGLLIEWFTVDSKAAEAKIWPKMNQNNLYLFISMLESDQVEIQL